MAIKFVAPRVALVDSNGNITREWYLFFQGIFDRVGGSTGSSTTDLSASAFEDAGIEETKAALFRAIIDFGQNTVPQPDFIPAGDVTPLAQAAQDISHLQAELASQRDTITELTKVVQGLQQGIMI